MALYSATADSLALTAATVKSLVEVSVPANRQIRLVDVSVSFQGVAADAAPALVSIIRATATMTGTSYTALGFDPADGTSGMTVKVNATAEGTVAANPLMVWRIHPQTGLVYQFPLGREIVVAASGFIRVRANAPAAVNCAVTLTWDE